MLTRLMVENVALIQRQELFLAGGLTVITGETGAGKSLFLDALGLLLGERADSGLVREGAQRAMVQGLFRIPPTHPVREWLRERSLELPEEGEQLYLRRVLNANGRSQAFVNELAVPVATLKALGDQLVDLHGQHQHQSLLDTTTHLTILDAFAGCQGEAEATAHACGQWRHHHAALEELRARAAAATQRRDFLAFQCEELAAAGVVAGELEELEGRRARLVHATRLAQLTGEAADLLEGGNAAARLAGRAAALVEQGREWDPTLESLAEGIRSLHYELEEAAARLRHYHEGVALDPDALAALEERIDLIRRLARKHHCDPDRLPGLLQEWRMELEGLDHLEEREGELEGAVAAADGLYQERAAALGTARRQAARGLEKALERELKGLHMGSTRLAVVFGERSGPPHPRGREEATFQVSTNPGEPLKPLRQVASGGEMARLMLALKKVLMDAVTIPTLIFDEVDVGVGGRVASAIGTRLREVAGGRQVLAITHQPQVAAWGEGHWVVEKVESGGRMVVRTRSLDPEARVEELARMLAGDTITESARHNAREMLAGAGDSAPPPAAPPRRRRPPPRG